MSVLEAREAFRSPNGLNIGSVLVDRGVLQTAHLPAESACCQMEAVPKVCGTTGRWAILACVLGGPPPRVK